MKEDKNKANTNTLQCYYMWDGVITTSHKTWKSLTYYIPLPTEYVQRLWCMPETGKGKALCILCFVLFAQNIPMVFNLWIVKGKDNSSN